MESTPKNESAPKNEDMASFPCDNQGPRGREWMDTKTSDVPTRRDLRYWVDIWGGKLLNVLFLICCFWSQIRQWGKPLWGCWVTWSLPGEEMCFELSCFSYFFHSWHTLQGMSPQESSVGQGVPNAMALSSLEFWVIQGCQVTLLLGSWMCILAACLLSCF